MQDDTSDTGSGAVSGAGAAVSIYASDAVVVVDADATLRQVAGTIAAETAGCVVVGAVDDVVGVVSERDIARLVGEGVDLDRTTADHLAGRELVWVDPDAPVGEVAVQMMQSYVRHVLVGDGTRVRGIVSMRDIIAAYTT